MTTDKVKKFMKQIEIHRNAIALDRDKLRTTIEEMEDLQGCCSEAVELLDEALEKLSELV